MLGVLLLPPVLLVVVPSLACLPACLMQRNGMCTLGACQHILLLMGCLPAHLLACLLAGHPRWVFLGEALPSCMLALALPWLLPNGPDDSLALGLSPGELDILRAEV